jgi:Protein of unknown function (DUF1592)/Protein of unknown function (DUF1588)
VRLGVALSVMSLLAVACGKTDANGRAAAAAGASVGGSGVSAGGTAAGGSAGVGGALQPARCNVDLDERCRAFELGSPHAMLLRPDEYQNAIATLFGTTVDVEGLLPGPYGPFPTQDRAALASVPQTAYPEAAARAAEQLTFDAAKLQPCPGAGCVAQFVGDYAPRVWRGIVSADDQALLIATYDATIGEPRDQLRALLEKLLSSPRFYMRIELGDSSLTGPRPLDGFELAAKLSFLFWSDTPDDQLLDLARDGSLKRPAVLVEQTRRLLADPRAARGLANFYRSWLRLDHLDTTQRDALLFPSWTPELPANMKRETIDFLNWHILQGDATLDAVLTADFSFVSPDLAELYGVAAPNAPFGRVQLPAERRGLLTQASLLTLTSHSTQTSPVGRAMLVRERLRCQSVPYVDDIHGFGGIKIDDTLPAREQAHWLNETPCAQCHQLLEPLGFGFESFDAIGRYRTEADGSPVDASGSLPWPEMTPFEFDGVPELEQYLAEAPETLPCFAERALEWSGTPYSRCGAGQAVLQTCQAGDLRETLAQLTATEAFRFVGPAYYAVGEETKKPSCTVSGVSDCQYLAEHSGVDLKTCEACQGAPCDTPGCAQFGCQGVSVVHGCCNDEDCHSLTPFCGLHTGTHFVCVKDDAI